MVVIFICLIAVACLDQAVTIPLKEAMVWTFTAFNTFLAAEILLSMMLRLFSPRRPNTLPRPAFDFYLLEALSHPMQIGRTIASMLEGIFGFDITHTPFGKMVYSLIIPSAILVATLLLGLSSIVIVKPYEQAVILNMGRLGREPLSPGLHFKPPWPFASSQRYNISEMRSIHVGSHKPSPSDAALYREGVPILWTNMHGVTIDELLICSSPRDMITISAKSEQSRADNQKVPSVSLAAADIQIQYIIKDLMTHVSSSAMPEIFLYKISETHSSRLIYQYDIDALFCEGRLALVDMLRKAIQRDCDKNNLGIKIVHVAITAVHPPVEVAGAFEETVAAMQERETKIQQARQEAIMSQVETTGLTETFARLAALADGIDSGHGTDISGHEQLLYDCGGEVSSILAEAGAYRFSRENVEKGKTERFGEQLRANIASPIIYGYDQYLSILEKGLAKNRKVVILGNDDRIIIRKDMESLGEMELISEETGF
jgi:membrane protease subunit HflK